MDDIILFKTERLKIIEYSLERLDEIFTIYKDFDIIKYTTTDGKAKTKEQLTKVIEAYNAMYFECSNAQGKWLIIEKTSDKAIGYVGIFYIDEIKGTELSYALLTEYRGKGYASEALEGLKHYAFENLKLPEVCSLIRLDNTASIKVAERTGMVYKEDSNVWGFEFKLYTINNTVVDRRY